jgi:hypothetical protein
LLLQYAAGVGCDVLEGIDGVGPVRMLEVVASPFYSLEQVTRLVEL